MQYTRILLVVAAGTGAFHSGSGALALEPDKIFEKASPSVWVVRALDAQQRPFSIGSGVVVAPGKIVTNCHVLAKARRIEVRRANSVYPATLEFPDIERDLCQINVPNLAAPVAEIGTAQGLRVGQAVYGISAPHGEELALMPAVISLLREAEGGYSLVQTNVPVERGSSGGGLFNAEGRLIAVKSSRRVSGQVFALPADWVREVPARGQTALARLRSEEAAAATKSPYPRILAGDELRTHVENLRRVNVQGPPDLTSLTFEPGGRLITVSTNQWSPSGIQHQGSFQVRPGENLVCMQHRMLGHFRSRTIAENLDGCFQVLQTGQRSYSLKAAAGDFSVAYEVP